MKGERNSENFNNKTEEQKQVEKEEEEQAKNQQLNITILQHFIFMHKTHTIIDSAFEYEAPIRDQVINIRTQQILHKSSFSLPEHIFALCFDVCCRTHIF